MTKQTINVNKISNRTLRKWMNEIVTMVFDPRCEPHKLLSVLRANFSCVAPRKVVQAKLSPPVQVGARSHSTSDLHTFAFNNAGFAQTCRDIFKARGISGTDALIPIIKALRAGTGCGLKEAKDFTDGNMNMLIARYAQQPRRRSSRAAFRAQESTF